MHIRYILILLLILISSPDWAQQPKSASKQSRENIRIQEVSKAIEEGKSDMEVAESYEKLARELSGKGEYAKAEDYLTRAKRIYQIRGEKEKLAIVERELAKVQEAQNKINDAFYNFSSAQSNTSNKKMQKINANDMQRVANYNNPAVQSGYIQQNILLAEELDSKEDKVLAYRQMAQVNKDMNNAPEAIRNLEKALVTVQDQPEASMQIRQDIASTYASDNQIGKAIEINKDLVAEAKETNNPKAEIKQLQALSENYLEANKLAEGVSALQQAYNLAIDNGQTIEAKNSLELLVEQYRKMRQPQKALDAYSDFMKKLEGLVKNDSTLLDERFFHVQEEKILRLEKERALKDELISRTNRFNYILLIAIVLILISLVYSQSPLFHQEEE